jgi:hypothetical protein
MAKTEYTERDVEAAFALLIGLYQHSRKGPKLVLLSNDTDPTETEAREALGRVLISIAEGLKFKDSRGFLLGIMAEVFAPHAVAQGFHSSPMKIHLKRRSNNARSTPHRDSLIVEEVRSRMAKGETYNKATADVAEAFGYKDPRRVQELYGREKRLWNLWQSRVRR